jgi:DNA-binding protein H-NS
MSRVKELDAQIKKLLEEKEKVFSAERTAALADVKEKIATFAFTPKELGIKLVKVADGRKSKKESKIATKKTAKKVGKKAARKPYKSSGMYFDLDGQKIPIRRGNTPKEVKAYAVAKGIPVESLKRNADGSPFKK